MPVAVTSFSPLTISLPSTTSFFTSTCALEEEHEEGNPKRHLKEHHTDKHVHVLPPIGAQSVSFRVFLLRLLSLQPVTRRPVTPLTLRPAADLPLHPTLQLDMHHHTCRLAKVEPSFSSRNAKSPPPAVRPVFTQPPTRSVRPTCVRPSC